MRLKKLSTKFVLVPSSEEYAFGSPSHPVGTDDIVVAAVLVREDLRVA